MQTLTPYFNTIGRVLISAIFLFSGISKVSAYAATQGYMAAMGVPGEVLPLHVAPERLHLFDTDTGARLGGT